MPDQKTYRGFRDFYPDYLRAHQNRTNRRLHFLGTSLVILLAAWILASGAWSWLLVLPVVLCVAFSAMHNALCSGK